MRMVLHISAGLLFLLLACCGSSRKDLKEPESGIARYQAEAVQKYGQGAEFVFNDNKTVVVCLKKSKPSSQYPQQQVSFFVFDLSIDSTIFEDNIANGSVGWKDNFSVVVNITPGMEKGEDAFPPTRHGYIYDIRIRKTRELNSAPVQ